MSGQRQICDGVPRGIGIPAKRHAVLACPRRVVGVKTNGGCLCIPPRRSTARIIPGRMVVWNTVFPYSDAAISRSVSGDPSGGIEIAGVIMPCWDNEDGQQETEHGRP
jgi:hypothetical protein